MNFVRKSFWKIKLHTLLQKKLDISENEAWSVLNKFLPGRCIAPSFSQHVKYLPRVDLMIVIPVYNVAPFLEQCILSVLNQKTRFSYVAVCVDDGSTDGSGEILDKYRDQKSIIIIHQENHGLSGARNAGLKKILGEYVYFLDSDDFMTEDAIEILMSIARKNDADIVEGSHYLYTSNGEKKLIDHAGNQGSSAKEELFGYAWGKVIRSSFFCNLCFPDGYLFEDTIMGTILYPECERVVTLPNPLLYYRKNPLGIVETAGKKKETIDTFWLTKYCIEEADRRGLFATNWHLPLFYNKMWLDYLRVREMPLDIKQSIFLLNCELYQRYFVYAAKNENGKYDWLKKVLISRSYAAYEYLMQRWIVIDE